MRFRLSILCAAALAAVPAAAQSPVHQHYLPFDGQAQPGPGGQLAPRLQNLGSHAFKVTTRSTRAQQFINQGVNLAYGFNHPEAGRAFAEAARLDPSCAMAYWGQALVLGPNINAAMAAEDEPKARALAEKAMSIRSGVTPRERAYIEALNVRYTGKAEERSSADLAYANAMRTVHKRFPADRDAATLFAESLMDLRPWNYWTRDGLPYDGTMEAVDTIGRVLAADPNHPGALHYWIHLWEPTKTPERAEKEADRLVPLMPGAGHVVHMPGHIYLRVGRYIDAVKVNEKAVAADEDYITQCKVQGLYPLGYYPHNIHFIWMGATMSGQSAMAITAARKVASVIPHEAIAAAPPVQGFLAVPYYAYIRFGKWDEILAEAAPAHDTIFIRGVWHFARGMAFSARGRAADAAAELEALKKIVADPALATSGASASPNPPDAILRIAPDVLEGEMAARSKDYDRAVLLLDRAVRYEDALVYTEPPDWPASVRLTLGAVLLEAGRPVEAEAVYWDDLKRYPENGWALFGLVQALTAQGKKADADRVQARFDKAWSAADVKLTSSRF